MGPTRTKDERKSLASTSAAELTGNSIPEPPSAIPSAKAKKLPACDSCKLRRVLCIPQPQPQSCPRCVDKGIVCTTTPTVRKKPIGRTGKRIEEAKATFGAADPNSPAFQGPSNTPWIPTRPQMAIAAPGSPSSLSMTDADSRLGLVEMSGALAAHLIDLYQHIPQSWLPLFPRGKLGIQFEQSGRRLDGLPPQTEVLARTIIALTSRLSSSPALLGPGDPAPPFETLARGFHGRSDRQDFRAFGARRELRCEALRVQAVRMAWERGTLVEPSEDSAAACYLLELLEGRTDPQRGKPYGSAFVSHLRTLLDNADRPGAPRVMSMSLGWSSLMMREALYATNAGRTSHFTMTDHRLLCGETPPTIEEALLTTVVDVDVRDAVTLFFGPMSPFAYHVARLARECNDNITGTRAKKEALDERYVAKYLTQVEHLFHLLMILEARIAFVLSPAATAAHALPGLFETERRYIMNACLHTLKLAWAGLSLPLYANLIRRVAELRHGTSATVGERRRARERIEVLATQVHTVTLKGARMVASCVKNAPSLAFQVFLAQENLTAWSAVLREAKTVEQGGTGITRAEKESDLRDMAEGLKVMGWSWSDNEPLIDAIEGSLHALQLEAAPPTAEATPDAPTEPLTTAADEVQSTSAPSPIDYASFFNPPSPPPTEPPAPAVSSSLDSLFGNLPVFDGTALGGGIDLSSLAASALSGSGLAGMEGVAAAMGMSTEGLASLGAALGLGGLSGLAGFGGVEGTELGPNTGLGTGAPPVSGGGLTMPSGFQFGGLNPAIISQMTGFGTQPSQAEAPASAGGGGWLDV